MLTYIESFFSDPINTLVIFLLAFPGRILALSAHEFAHAWVAHRCGDDTAKMMGRMTLNPFKHLDPLGTVLMLVVGFGWAKPVPVNPRNFRHYRQDDLKVSLAGVTMNLIMFILAMVVMTIIVGITLSKVPQGDVYTTTNVPIFRAIYFGHDALLFPDTNSYLPLMKMLYNLPFSPGGNLIAPVYGKVWGYLYDMLGYFAFTNLVLCLFNLLPVPPLDGYHVMNDLVLHRNLFADPRTARIASSVLFVLVMTGAVGRVLGWVDEQVLTGCGNLAAAALRAMGLMT